MSGRWRANRGGQRKATAVAVAAIEWGDPILSSAVSTVVEGRLYYRGQDAVELSEEKAFEEVARILWGVDVADGPAEDTGREGGVAGSRRTRSSRARVRARAGPRGAASLGEAIPRDDANRPLKIPRPLDIPGEVPNTPRGSRKVFFLAAFARAFLALGLRARRTSRRMVARCRPCRPRRTRC